MHVVIMGCGRVGSEVGRSLSTEGHEVTIIDYDPNALEKLGPEFKGRIIKGVGFDRNVLMQAGIEQANAFVATSASDNANIIAARIARNIFHVPCVVARFYDPGRAEICRRLGLLTISPTLWGAERIRELVLHRELDPTMVFGSGEVSVIRAEIPNFLVGRTVKQLSVPGEVNVISITRKGKAFLPNFGTELRDGDVLHLAIDANAMDRIKNLLGLETGE